MTITQQILRIWLGSDFSTDALIDIINNAKINHSSNTIFNFNRPNKDQQGTTIKRSVQTRIDEFFKNKQSRINESDIDTNNQESKHLVFGDAPPPNKQNYTRIVAANVNGISMRDNMAKLHILGQSADTLNIDFLGLIETNLDYKYEGVKDQCHKILRRYFKQTRICEASSELNPDRAHKPGGVLSVLAFPWASRSKARADESLGRWTETTINGKGNRKVTIITAYNVCPQSESEVSEKKYTAWTQQWHILKRKHPGRPDLNPRKQMLQDLSERIKTIKNSGHEVIILIDANDSLQQLNSDLTSWVRSLELVDIIAEKHGTIDEPATHARGSQRIDYIFTTEKIFEYVGACGILPLHELCFSDHRALYADIDIKAYLGGDLPDTIHRATREVHSNDPRTVQKFQKLMEKALDESDLEAKISSIKEKLNYGEHNDNIKQDLEEIDVLFTAMKLECEKKCGNSHKLPWSPTLKEANNTRMFWSLWLSQSRSKGKRDFHINRQKYVNKDTEPYADLNYIERKVIYANLKRAYRHLQECRLRAKELRQEHLTERANMALDNGQKDIHSIIIAIKKAEARRDMFAKLKRLKCNPISHGIDHVIVEDQDGQRITITDIDDMYKTLISYNKEHFSQADGTPFTTEPIKSRLGTCATSQFVQDILDGKVDTEDLELNEAATAILQQLSKRLSNSLIDIDISTEDIIKGYKKWPEYTSTSPSGCHLGIDKAMLRFQRTQEKVAEESTKLPPYMRYFEIKAFIINSALKTGHVYQRWTKVVNALIEKIPGTPLAGKLRVIHLLENDFNFMIGTIFGRRLIWAGEDINAFNDGQGGSRPSRRTQELLLIKHLKYATLRLSKMNGSSFDNDAKSCFDRIVMPVASIAAQQLGMPPAACEIFLSTLSKIRYHVKTVYGISEESYSTTSDYTIHGPGQGGRGSPSVWVIVSSLIMHCLSRKSEGFTMYNPYDLNDKFTNWMTGFVDDVTHWCSNQDTQSEEAAIHEIQKTAQWWEQLLYATGGKLELSKCFFYVLQWDFDTEGIGFLRPKHQFQNMVLLNSSETNLAVSIPQKEFNEPHKTLGVMECPNGDNKSEFDRLYKKSLSLVQRITTKKINPYESQLYYFTTYLPSMTYGFTVGTFTEKQLGTIQRSVTPHFSSSMGFVRSIPTEIKFGPKNLGGMGMRSLFAEQGTEKSLSILRYLRCERPVSKTLWMYLRWCQRIAGTSFSILDDPFTPLPHLEDEGWITTLREFLRESEISIEIPNLAPDYLQCNDDIYIIDAAIGFGFKNIELERINRCRLYLQATTLSDLCNELGTRLRTDSVLCSPSAKVKDKGMWPVQPRPGPTHQESWQKFLRKFCKNETEYTLYDPLGHWHVAEIRQHESQEFFVDEENTRVYQIANNICMYGIIEDRRKFHIFTNLTPCEIPSNLSRLIPAKLPDRYSDRITWRSRRKDRTAMDYEITDEWAQYISQLQEWEKQILLYINMKCDETELQEKLSSDSITLICVSDGSASNNIGTFGWVIAHDNIQLVEGYGGVPGFPVTSLRSEGCGKLAWLTWLYHYKNFRSIDVRCSIQSFCDNKGVVSKTRRWNDYSNPSHTTTPNFDIFKTIYQQQILFGRNTIPDTQWVKGHQDSNKPIRELPIPAQLNVHADSLAEHALQMITRKEIEYPQYKFPQGIVWIYNHSNHQYYSSQETSLLRWKYSELELHKYYHKKVFHVKLKELHEINWAGLRIARSRLSTSDQNFSIKQMIGWLPVGHKTKQYGQLINQCPFCHHPDEDIDHLWQCPSRLEANKTIVTDFTQFLAKENTAPEIIHAFAIALNHWFRIKQTYTREDRKHILWTMIEKQKRIGWKFFVRGLLITDWACWQERYNSQILGDSWSATISAWWINQSRKIWNQRNDKLHQHTKDNESLSEQETFAQVRKLYDTARLLSANDRELFDIPLEDLLKHPIHSLQSWVKTAWPTVKICVQHHTERLVNHQKRLSELFRTIQTPTTDIVSDDQDITVILEPQSQQTSEPTQENDQSIPTTLTNSENESNIEFDSTHINDNIITSLSTSHNTIFTVKNPFP